MEYKKPFISDEEGKELRFLKKDISLVRLTVHF